MALLHGLDDWPGVVLRCASEQRAGAVGSVPAGGRFWGAYLNADADGDRLGFNDRHLLPFSVAPQHRAGAVVDEGFIDDPGLAQQVLVALMGKHFERVQQLPIGVGPEGQAQAPAQGLLGEDL